jgi:hypothetical protein
MVARVSREGALHILIQHIIPTYSCMHNTYVHMHNKDLHRRYKKFVDDVYREK